MASDNLRGHAGRLSRKKMIKSGHSNKDHLSDSRTFKFSVAAPCYGSLSHPIQNKRSKWGQNTGQE